MKAFAGDVVKSYAGRVLMLVENAFPADSRVRNEAYTLGNDGYKVSVIALRNPGEPYRELVNGIAVYRIPRLTVFKKLPANRPSRIRKLVSKLQSVAGYVTEYGYFTLGCLTLSFYVALREGFDVIHAHNPPDTLFVVGAAHRLFGKKFVFDHHDLSPELYRSRYGKTASPLVSQVLQRLERNSVRLASVVIATNASYRDIDIQRHGIDPRKVFIVRNGPDLKRVRLVEPDRRLKAMGRTILGYVGAMNPQDGVDYLLRAVHYLLNDLKRSDFYCVLIGDGDSKPELEALTKTLGLQDHVWLTGYVSDDDMIRYLSTADICLDPNPSSPLNDVSTWIKVMEYMALGKPIVSFDLKETRTSAGAAAVYVPPNDEAAFGKAVLELMNDPARRSEMGEVGKSRVQHELNWGITSRNLLDAYNYLFKRGSQLADGTSGVAALPPEPGAGAVQASPPAGLAGARYSRETDIQ